MAGSVLDTEIQKYLPLLGDEEKFSLLTVIRSFLNIKKESSNEIFMSSYNNDIDAAMLRIDTGEYISNEEVEKEMELW